MAVRDRRRPLFTLSTAPRHEPTAFGGRLMEVAQLKAPFRVVLTPTKDRSHGQWRHHWQTSTGPRIPSTGHERPVRQCRRPAPSGEDTPAANVRVDERATHRLWRLRPATGIRTACWPP